jgi:broad specificity phosphatase PhoE
MVQGHLNGELTPLGEAQAELVAARLKAEPLDLILSSDLKRAYNTATTIAKEHSHSVIPLTDLRERSWGVFDGKPLDDYYKALNESGVAHHDFVPENGEGLHHLKLRTTRFISEWSERMSGKTTLIVAHHSMNKMLISCLLNRDLSEWYSFEQTNTCVNVLEGSSISDLSGTLINCSKHLESLLHPTSISN